MDNALTVYKSLQDKPLNKTQEETALLVADDKLTDEQIAETAGVSRQTLAKWKKLPTFVAAVEAHKTAWREKVMKSGIADKANRIAAKNRRWEKLNRVIEARAKRYGAEIDAEATGLNALAGDDDTAEKPRLPPEEAREGVIIEKVTYTKTGQRIEWATDNALLSEMRALENEAEEELGQKVIKTEQTISGTIGVGVVPITEVLVHKPRKDE